MNATRELYQQVILDHNRAPRNFGKIETPSRKAEGMNPLCGDKLSVYLLLDGDLISDIRFEGTGCAISKASASMMSASVKAKSIGRARELFEAFHRLITGEKAKAQDAELLGKLAVFSGVAEFPSRVKCASLPWHALVAALEKKEAPVSTE